MKNRIIYIVGKTLALLILICSCKSEKKKPVVVSEPIAVNYLEESKIDFDKRMEWWRNARFGMFIHWGPYAIPAGIHNGKPVDGIGEWIMNNAHIPIKEYEVFSKQFDPKKFNADEWAIIMKDAGMKYVVITSKHHDGFCLWDSKVSEYDIIDFSPYKKDILKELSKACKKQGIKFGVYHSIMDWHHPDAQSINYPEYNNASKPGGNPNFPSYLENYLKPQMRELVDDYDVEIMWFDGEWIDEFTHDQGKELYQYVRSLKPSILINNRVDKGRQGMQGMNKADADYAGDFGTPEQEILEGSSALDWESCMTMNDTWGFKKNDHNWKSAQTLVHNLIDVAAKGGNYLLNVGPTAEGLIPEPSVERLKAVGEWLQTNSEAIYNTEKLKSSYRQGNDILFTKSKGKDVYYAMCLTKPKAEVIIEHLQPQEGTEITLLGSSAPLKWTYEQGKGTTISVSTEVLEEQNEEYAWTFKINGNEIENKISE